VNVRFTNEPSYGPRHLWPPTTCMWPGSQPYFCMTLAASRADNFEEHLRGCKWDSILISDVFDFFMSYESIVNGSLMTGDIPYDDIVDDFILSQTPKLIFCSSGPWTVYSLGPVDTFGGSTWPSLLASFKVDSRYAPPKASSQFYAFDAHFLGSIDQNLNIVGYPPIHQHHFHLGHAFTWPLRGPAPWNDFAVGQTGGLGAPPEMMSTHGENQCPIDEGGQRCQVRSLPEGFAFLEKSPLGAVNTFLDVRPAGSVPLRSWLTIALKHTKVTQATMAMTWQALAANARVTSSRATYTIETRLDSVIWNEGVVFIRNVAEAIMHVHDSNILDAWLFDGVANQVFHNLEKVQRSFGEIDYSKNVIDTTMASVKARQLKPGSASLLCAYRLSSKPEWLSVGGTLTKFQRITRCPVHFKRYVIIAFHRTSSAFPMSTARMHATLKLLGSSNMTY